jgi:amidase
MLAVVPHLRPSTSADRPASRIIVDEKKQGRASADQNLESQRRQYELVDIARRRGFQDVEVGREALPKSGCKPAHKPACNWEPAEIGTIVRPLPEVPPVITVSGFRGPRLLHPARRRRWGSSPCDRLMLSTSRRPGGQDVPFILGKLMNAVSFLTASRLAAMIREREIGCVELLDYFLDRVVRFNPTVNAIVVLDVERARRRARDADAALARGVTVGPLHGVPMTIKESFQLEGTPTTFGVPAYRDNIAKRNALAVDRLLAAGANIFGKTNVPPWLADAQSANEIYGRSCNPWNLAHSPGGSSGGAAAALAAGLTGLEMGSDIASSIRNPAHYCGVFGHKPTYALCAARGHSLTDDRPGSDISVIGPLARGADDLELLLSIIAKPEEPADGAYAVALPPSPKRELCDFRVALVLDDDFAETDEAIRAPLRALGSFLASNGAQVSIGARPDFDSREIFELYSLLFRASTADGQSDAEFARNVEMAKALPPEADSMQALALRAAAMSHRDWLSLDARRHGYRRGWNAWFEHFDVLLCPVLTTAAIPHMAAPPWERTLIVNGKPQPWANQLFWAGYGAAFYLPASVAPIGMTAGGLPVGVQIIGRQYADLTCIHFARLLERDYRGFVPPPGYD